MKAKLLMTIAIFSLVLAREQVYSQAAAAPQARLDPNMISFFTGHWKGAGEFAGGAKIAADVDFTLTLDSCWLLYEHRDQAPNTYKATSMWGVDGKTGQLLAYTFDNFHGHRQWMSNGWVDGKLVLSGGSFYSPGGMVFEHFIYERLSAGQFKMTYEVSRDGITWRTGDWLVFTRSGG